MPAKTGAPLMNSLLRFLIPVVLLAGNVPAAEPARPNVILIMADDLGYRDLGCYGHEKIRTPVLDKLASGGVRLTNFHSGSSVCTPSRMALLTGAYPVRIGWTQGVVGHLIPGDQGMSPEALTIAEIFRSEGYATGISGKWHIGSGPTTGPLAQGFDEAFFIKLSNNLSKKVWQGEQLDTRPFDNRLLTERFTEAAIRFVRTHHEKPFFLYLPFTAPHFPVQAHPDWDGRSSFGAYGDVVEEMDFRIGEILKVLEDLGERENTLIVFTSDNGPQGNQPARATPFRGAKWSALEGGTRVPCIINWPDVVAAGRESNKLVAAIDLLPSLSRACGIDWRSKSKDKPKIDGMDVWDTLTGAGGEHPRRSLLHWQGKSPEPMALTHDSWKLFFNGRDALEGGGTDLGTPEQNNAAALLLKNLGEENRPLLFHLAEDDGEIVDVSFENPQKVTELLEISVKLKAELAAVEPLPLTESKPLE
jgi:arylsulfatase